MHVQNKRIFVGNLPPNINEKEIKKQFSDYGNVVSVDIKHRKTNVNNDISPIFAFVNVEIDNSTIQKCFHELSNYNWQGYYVKLELAKESFLERLKREREETQAKTIQNNSLNVLNSQDEIYTSNTIKQNNSNKKLYHSSSESDDEQTKQNDNIVSVETICMQKNNTSILKSNKYSSSSDSDHSDSYCKKQSKVKNITEKPLELTEENDSDDIKLIIKSNKHKTKNNALKIESVSSTSIQTITPIGSKNETKDKRALEADAKRKQSLIKMKQSYNQQKFLIKNALSKIDTTQNKIIFDDNGQEKPSKRKNITNNGSSFYKKQKLSLFNEDDDDQEDNINFEVKNQFEGKQGGKLLQLQSKFANDKRFALDERFADDNEEENKLEMPDDDERNKQFEILESILGKKVRKEHRDDKNTNIPKSMIRFDPSKPEHSKFEIKRSEVSKKDKKKDKSKEKQKSEESLLPPPEVSKEKFYKVKTNFKESLKENEGFSLLGLFGREAEIDNAEDKPEISTELNKSKKFDFDHNPFKYDSSDTEDDDESKQKGKQLRNEAEKVESKSFKWSEPFFFHVGDNRLKDGYKFLTNIKNIENSQTFSQKRVEIARITHGKAKNKIRDKRKFQQKLRKRIKVKIAKRL